MHINQKNTNKKEVIVRKDFEDSFPETSNLTIAICS